jgi:hypothetical protein
MNRLGIITAIFLLVISGRVSGQIESVTVSATNNHNVGSVLTGGYTGTLNAANYLEYEWFYSPSATSIGTDQTYTILSGDQSEYIYLTVTEKVIATDDFVIDFSSVPVKVNSYPDAGSLSIIGTLKVNSTLYASYLYSDVDGDIEGTTVINWYRDTDGTGTSWSTSIATGRTFLLTNNEFDKLVRFSVTPVASSGSTDGTEATSSNSTVVLNPPPTATGLSIAGTARVGNTLTANYTYSDNEGDIEGASVINWYRDTDGTGTSWSTSIATGRTFLLTNSEYEKLVKFTVTPVALSGETTGTDVESSETAVVTNPPPTATGLSIAGTARVGNTLTANYTYSDNEGDIEGASVINWYRDTDGTGTSWSTSIATGRTFLLTNSEYEKLVKFTVTPVALSGETTGTDIESSESAVVTNPPPIATVSAITGGLNVGNVLTGNYIYSDAEGDIEGSSIYEWWKSSDPSGTPSSLIDGATSRTYQLTLADQGKYLVFKVKPIAQTGTTNGTIQSSLASGRVNSAPVASSVGITGAAELGVTLTGTYSFFDLDGNAEGSSVFEWLRDDVVIPGANSKNYTIALEDVGTRIKFRVTPVAEAGYPDTGTSVTSAQTEIVTDPSGDLPEAVDICISGTRSVGSVLTGKYTFVDKFSEKDSEYAWYRGATPIAGAISISYTLISEDIECEIRFAVTPKNNKGGVGVKSYSAPLAIMGPLLTTYSIRDPLVTLTATPGSGIFYGHGVSGGFFNPELAGVGGPYAINYVLNISLPTNSCTQNASRNVSVNPVTSYFESFRDFYCHDGGHDTIYVSKVPAGATDKTFSMTNAAAIVGLLADTAIIIDPGLMRPGINVDSIFFSYNWESSFYSLEKALVIDSIGTDLAIANLDPAYCIGSVKRFITAAGVYPAGGNGFWTGDILSDPTATNAFVDPSKGTEGITYPITYRYISPIGCSSALISRSVKINPLPDPSFDLDPTYNVDGPQVTLVSVSPDGTFVGPGVFGSTFYPSVAGQGVHELRHYVTDINGCSSNTLRTTTVRKAAGTFSGITNIICYKDTTYTVTVTGLPTGITITGFTSKSGGLTWDTGTANGDYHVPTAGAGFDTLKFSYLWSAVPYFITQPVFIDAIGNITIIGIKDNYCDYEGVVNLRVFVENSTGSGNFSFSGPSAAFTNYGNMADFDPSLTPSSATPYTIYYTHISSVNSSGCSKTFASNLMVNKAPDVSIIKTRTTVNIEEPPLVLEGTPANGFFSGTGVYSYAGGYVFNPAIAGLGKTGILLTYVDALGCFSVAKDTLIVTRATGTIEGLNPANQYCYDGSDDTLRYESSELWFGGLFSGNGITDIGSGKAIFNPSLAGEGDHSIYFSYYDAMFTHYEIAQTVNVDLIGQVTIVNLPPDTSFCNNDPGFQLYTNREGGLFEGPVTGNNFDPAKGPGTEPVTYTYTNSSTGCSSSVSVPVTINPAPEVDFTVADVCIENSNDITRFINNTISADPVLSWLWEFRDEGAVLNSDEPDPGYLYKNGGLKQIKLTAITNNTCKASLEKTIDLGVKPVADFYWLNECYHPDDSVRLFDKTLIGSTITSRAWNFYDGQPPVTRTNPGYLKQAAGYLPVEYIVYTNYANCSDTILQDIFIRPTIVLTDSDDYFETFETGAGGWIKDPGSDNSWTLGTPDRETINAASSGISAWYTGYDIDNQKVQSSSVSSPCFDFSATQRPMLSLKLWRRFDRNRDGAALQFKVGDNTNWEYLGTLNDGIEWYNSTLIKGRPGGDQIGWTTVQDKDDNWIEARHKLDELNGMTDVKFRLAYGSDGSSQDNDGIAFDDFRIGTRSRNVLLEHFTNNSSSTVSDAYETVNTLIDALGKDIVNIRYHTNFPGTDQLYRDIPAEMSARVLFYGLSKVPLSVVDGGRGVTYDGIFNHTSQELLNDPNLYTNMLVKRSLISPRFHIEINPIISGGQLVVKADLEALESISAENLTLYVAVTAKDIKSLTGVNGETHFRHTLRNMLPDAGGTNLPKTWTRNQSFESNEFTWKIANIYDAEDIEIIAYIQNNVTHEIYQTVVSGINDITVGIEETFGINSAFKLYPNPTTGRVVFTFEEPPGGRALVEVIDFRGTVVKSFTIDSGQKSLVVDDISLPDGIYVIKMTAGNRILGLRKLMVAGR